MPLLLPGSSNPQSPRATKLVIPVHYSHSTPSPTPIKGFPLAINVINKLLGFHSRRYLTPAMHALALPPITPCTLFGRLICFAIVVLATIAITPPARGASPACVNPLGLKGLTSTIHPSTVALLPTLCERSLRECILVSPPPSVSPSPHCD